MNESSGHKVFARIHRYKGEVLGALLWVPAPMFEKSMAPGQEEIEVSFEGNHIVIGKEENPAVQAGHEHRAGTLDEGLLLSEA